MEESILPFKLNLEVVASVLGLSDLGHASQLDIILQHQRDRGLVLKSDQPMRCMAQLASDEVFPIYETIDDEECDEESGTLVAIEASDTTFEVQTNGESITLGPLYPIDSSTVQFDEFSIDGVRLHPVDINGEYLVTGTCNVSDLYVDKDDLARFLQRDDNRLPLYADPTSEHYAPELALAVQLHQALRIEKQGNPNRSMEDRVSSWLQKNRGNETASGARVSRLAVIINEGKKLP